MELEESPSSKRDFNKAMPLMAKLVDKIYEGWVKDDEAWLSDTEYKTETPFMRPTEVNVIDNEDEDFTTAEEIDEFEQDEPDNMYIYAGKNYKANADIEALSKLKRQSITQSKSASSNRGTDYMDLDDPEVMATREAAKLRAKERKEEQRRKREENKREMWEENGYRSFALDEVGEDDTEDEDHMDLDVEEESERDYDLVLKTGSVVEPDVIDGETGIILQ
jgi:muconolactone delta-isomerase